MSEPVFFHVDLDAFFAAVEVLDHPQYKGKPLIIGVPGPRSVASTCSYEARKYGVHSAMPMVTAMKLCPQAICIPGRMKRYSEKSREVMSILRSFAPEFIQASIDEAYLDMTGTERLYGRSADAARSLKKRILDETGLTVSIGIAPSRFLAKLASDFRKPDGLTRVPAGSEIEFIDTIGLAKLWGIGKSTLASLEKHHIRTTQELRALPPETLSRYFGEKGGEYLYKISRGIDPGIYDGESKSHSISSENTYYPDLYSLEAIDTFLLEMSQEVMFRAMDEGFMPRTVAVKIRYGDFTTVSIQATPEDGILNSKEVYEIARSLFRRKYTGEGVRLLGVGLYQLYEGEGLQQGDLFAEERERQRKLEKAVLKINAGGSRLTRASTLQKPQENEK